MMHLISEESKSQVFSGKSFTNSPVSQSHLQEWVLGSGVSPGIVLKNIKTIEQSPELAHESELFSLLYPEPKRLNMGRLDSYHLKKFEDCLKTSGWWLPAQNPFRCPINKNVQWGQFKPDNNTPMKENLNGGKYQSVKVNSEECDTYSCIFLTPEIKQWEQIAKNNGLKMPSLPSSPEDFDMGLAFWDWVKEHPEIPTIIGEGGKKAGCLFTLGQVPVAIPGITMWGKDGELLPELKILAEGGRHFLICHDSDIKFKTRKDCFSQFQKLAQKLEELGSRVYHLEIPKKRGVKMGIDDFIVSGGKFSQLTKKHWKNVAPPELPYGVEYQENLYIIKYCHDKVKVRDLILELCQDRVLYNYLTKDFVVDGQKIELDEFAYHIEEKFKIKFLREDQLFSTFRYVVRSFSPVASYLNSLSAENPEYIDEYIRKTLFITNPLQIKMIRKKLIATCALGIAGEKVPTKDDTALILKGPQGIGKSTFLKILASPELFCDNIYNFLDKDERIKAHKYWIIEWQELETFLGRRETSLVKSILSTQEDHLRKPYARVDERMVRHFSIWGTTNQNEFLSDNTGNRRYRIINVNQKIDLEYARINRDKLWAAVKAAYVSGEKWWFDSQEESEIENENFQYTIKDRDLGETIAPVLADLLSQGMDTISISSLKLQQLLEKKLVELGSSVHLNFKALKHYMESLGCVYRKSLLGDKQGKRGYIVSATYKVMNLISSFGLSIKGHNEDNSQIVKPLDKKADIADVSLVINDTCHFSNPETESDTAHMAHMAPLSTNFSINEKEKNEERERPIEIPKKIDNRDDQEEEETLIHYQIGDYVRDISGGPRVDQPQPEQIYIVKEILEEPIAGCPGAYGKYIIEDLLGQFMAYNIGGWFLEKVASDNKKLLEIKDKKIRATSALNAESLSSSQFEKRQKCSIPSVIEDNSSAIENFAFSKNQAEDNFKTPNEY
jgi:hypothetical protein